MTFGRLALVLLALSAAVAFASTTSQHSPVPFLLWSRSDIQLPSQAGSQQASSVQEAMALLESSLSTARPEALVSFISPKMSSAQASVLFSAYDPSQSVSMPQLKQSIEQASVSLALPAVYLERHSTVSAGLISLFERLSHIQGSHIVRGSVKSSCSTLLATLSSSNLFSNGVTDLILISLDDVVSANDACFSQVLSAISTSSNNNYLALFSADSSPIIQSAFRTNEQAAVVPMLLETQAFTTQATPYNPPTGVYNITSDILFGLLFGLLFLVATLVGICCLDSIQTPLRFLPPNRKFPVGKEY